MPTQNDSSNNATATLYDLFAAEWDYQLEQNPTRASRLGDRRWNDRWKDQSFDAIAGRHEHNLQILNALQRIDREVLSGAERLNYDLFQKDHENAVEEHRYGWHLLPLNQLGGVQTADELGDALRFENRQDFEDWVERLHALPEHIEQTVALMREGLRQRILLPRIVLERIPNQIDHQIVDAAEESPFYKPFLQCAGVLAEEAQTGLASAAAKIILSEVVPAFRRFKEFLVNDYIAGSLDRPGIWQLPEGEAMYRFAVRRHTTTSLGPLEIHEIGRAEVARIREEMNTIKEELGHRGTLEEFAQSLCGNPQFYYLTAEELLSAYRALTRCIDPLLVRMFKTLPRTPYGVEPVPDKIAPDTTTAYYRRPAADGSRAGTFFVNLFRPETRPKYEMMVLSLHEAVPGHHLQIALAMEQERLPNFRRYGGYTAFMEGWGLYAESLGEELGLYDDPYSRFGRLTYEMWRAVRLVVDTGLHVHDLRWERQQAIDFLRENTGRQGPDVVNEIDRYIAMPGQALAYKTGQLKISAIRAKAESVLGDRFDIRAFHDELLRDGAMPLDLLEAKMDNWMATQ